MTDAMDEHHDPNLDEALDAMRHTLGRGPAEYVAQRHLSAMRMAARGPSVAPRPAPRLLWTPRWMATGVAAALGFLGGLAATDTLPNPAQHLVAQLVGHVGVDLPDPEGEGKGLTKDHEGGGEADTEDEGEAGTSEHADNHGGDVRAVANKNLLTQGDPLEGCEHGQAVRDVASSNAEPEGDAVGQTSEHDPCSGGEGAGTQGDGQGQGDEHRHQGAGSQSGGPGQSDGAGNSENAGSGPPSELGGED